MGLHPPSNSSRQTLLNVSDFKTLNAVVCLVFKYFSDELTITCEVVGLAKRWAGPGGQLARSHVTCGKYLNTFRSIISVLIRLNACTTR